MSVLELDLPSIEAGPGEKIFHRGTHRTLPPSDTVERVRPIMQAMGITRIANVTGLDHIGVPVVMVSRPNSRSVAVAQGKGIDLAAATASGLMESVETYHAEHILLPLKFASAEELRPHHRLVDLERLPQIANSEFHPKRPLLWIEGEDLMQRESVWLPYETVHTNYTLPYPPGSGCFMASSNGLASGNHFLEAVSHAITEIVERDAIALWSCLGIDRMGDKRLDLDTVEDPGCQEILEKYDRADMDVAVWNATSDVGIPAFICWIMERRSDNGCFKRASMGSGCHPARHIALSRALTEAAQDRLAVISGARDDLLAEDYDPPVDPEIEKAREAVFAQAGARLRFPDIVNMEGRTLEQDVAWEIGRLSAVGIDELVVVDLTQHGVFDLPVVRVVIPGLEGPHDSLSYVPGPRARAVLWETEEQAR